MIVIKGGKEGLKERKKGKKEEKKRGKDNVSCSSVSSY